MTKAYTLNVLIREVSALSSKSASTFATFASSLSPRAGASSRKVQVLNSFVGGQLRSIISGTASGVSGSSAKTRVLNALRARKRNGASSTSA